MKQLEVYIHVCKVKRKERIDCICMAEDKMCPEECERQYVNYDEFQDLEECFENRGVK